MPRPGRPAKPVELRRREGNPGKRPLPQPLGHLPGLQTRPPRGLGKDGRRLWRAVTTDAVAWLAPTDVTLLQLLCEAADERAELKRSVDEHGRFFTTSKGYVVPHPAVGQLRTLEERMTSWLSLLGFTPTDRVRLGLEVKRAGHLDALMRKRRAELGR